MKNIECRWKTLKELGNHDAFYFYRLAQGASSREFNTQELVWFDNIYLQRLRNNDPEAGRNRSAVVVETELKPATNYSYLVEITDANVGGEANICIFQPHQVFFTP